MHIRPDAPPKYVPRVTFPLFLGPRVHLAFNPRSFSCPAASPPPLLNILPLAFPHEEYFQYARHRHRHDHQRSCYTCARGSAQLLYRQSVSAEICQGPCVAVLTFAREDVLKAEQR
jgi:hypothetical protein